MVMVPGSNYCYESKIVIDIAFCALRIACKGRTWHFRTCKRSISARLSNLESQRVPAQNALIMPSMLAENRVWTHFSLNESCGEAHRSKNRIQ